VDFPDPYELIVDLMFLYHVITLLFLLIMLYSLPIYSSIIFLSILPTYPRSVVEGVDINYLMSSFLAIHYYCIY